MCGAPWARPYARALRSPGAAQARSCLLLCVSCDQRAWQFRGESTHAARAHRHDDVAIARDAQQRARQLVDALEIQRLHTTVRADRTTNRLAVRAGDRRLACCVDFRDDERIDAREHAREVIEQIACTCVTVRLEHENDSA